MAKFKMSQWKTWGQYEEAIEKGWKPKKPRQLESFPCRGGCGRVYISQPEDEGHYYYRMHSYLCLDCRKSIVEFLKQCKKKNQTPKQAPDSQMAPSTP